MATNERYIQVGFTALREPGTGEFLPAVPLYIKAEDGAEEAEQRLVQDLGKLFAERMRRYKEACRAAGIKEPIP